MWRFGTSIDFFFTVSIILASLFKFIVEVVFFFEFKCFEYLMLFLKANDLKLILIGHFLKAILDFEFFLEGLDFFFDGLVVPPGG